MKTFAAYDVNPRALYKALLDAKQPVIRIAFNGAPLREIPLAVVCCEDDADSGVVSGIVASIAGPERKSAQNDKEIAQLIKKVETK